MRRAISILVTLLLIFSVLGPVCAMAAEYEGISAQAPAKSPQPRLMASAANSYTINGVKVRLSDFSSKPGECWAYANNIYKKIWDETVSGSFSDSNNCLRELSDPQLTLTESHLKSYVTFAPLGSVLRITSAGYLHGNDASGHSQVIVAKSSSGFTVLEGGLSDAPYRQEHTYTWSEYVSTSWLGGKYKYIKYIMAPGVSAYRTSYSVTYSANGGSGAPAAQTKLSGTTLKLSSQKPTRSGYTFLGWATSASASAAAYQPGASYTKNAALKLYAVWKKAQPTYHVTTPVLSGCANVYGGTEVSWNAVSGAEKYNVYRKSGSSGWQKLSAVSGTSYIDTAVSGGVKYTYTVRAADASGNNLSDYDKTGKSVTYCAAPKLKQAAQDTGGLLVSWGKSTGAAKYNVYRKVPGGSWAKLACVSGTSYLDGSVKGGTDYIYTVRAANAEGKNLSSYDPTGITGCMYKAPKLGTAKAVFGGVQVTWGKTAGAATYNVYRKIPGGKWTKIANVADTSWFDTAAVSGKSNCYTVRGANASGENLTSYDANGVSALYYAAPLIQKGSSTAKGIEIAWGKVTGAAAYNVYRKVPGGKWTKIACVKGASYTDSKAKTGTAYIYTVRAADASGNNLSSYDPDGFQIKR